MPFFFTKSWPMRILISHFKRNTVQLQFDWSALLNRLRENPKWFVPKEPSLLGVNPYKVRVVLSKLIHAARVNICRPGVIHGPSTAKPSSCHVHCTLRVIPPTLPLSHLFYWHMQAQCAWCSSLCTWAMQSCLVINLWWSTRQNFIIPYSRKLLREF